MSCVGREEVGSKECGKGVCVSYLSEPAAQARRRYCYGADTR